MQQPYPRSILYSFRKLSFLSFRPYLQSITLILICTAIIAAPQAAQAGVNSWTSIGPDGGVVIALAVDPQNPAVVYISMGNAGFFKSTDGGASWRRGGNGLTDHFGGGLGLTDLAVDPATPTTLFAATSDGVFKSTDAGANWQPANQGVPGYPVYFLAFDPTTPTTIYAGHPFGLFKSIDSGITWQDLRTGLDNNSVNALVVDPTNPVKLFAGTDRGVFKSSDGGQNWSAASTGLPADLRTQAIIIHPANANVLFIGSSDSTGVYQSTNGGESWTPAGTGLTNGYVQVMAIDRNNPTTLYAGAIGGVFKSTNSASTWSASNTGMIDLSIQALALDPTNASILFAGTYGGGVFKSTDGSSQWQATNQGLTATYISSFVVDPKTPTTLYAATDYGRVVKTTTSGATWTLANQGLAATQICGQHALVIDAKAPATLYAGTRQGVYKSSNGGANWTSIFDTFFIFRCEISLAIDPTVSNNVYLGLGDTFYKSTNGGANWTLIISGLPNNNLIALTTILIDPKTPTTLYLGTDAGIYKSINSGNDWQAINTGLPANTRINTLVGHPQTTSTLFAATAHGLYKSTDSGLHWTIVNVTGTNASIASLALSPQTPTALLAGGSEGVYNSADGGENWHKVNGGLFNLNIQTLTFDPQSTAMAYVGTGGGGAFVAQIVPAPTITTQPANQTITRGQSTALSVAATDTTQLTYQWYQGSSGDSSSLLNGATSSTFTTPLLTASTRYWVQITNANGGSVDSDTAEITVVSPQAPTILSQPASQTINSGQRATLTVSANGAGLTYQWYQGNAGDTSLLITGATTSTLTTSALTSTTNFWVQVRNSGGSVNSTTATITIVPANVNIQITSQPTNQTITSGRTATLSVTAVGSDLTHQWYEGSSGDTRMPISGATNSTFTTPALTTTTSFWVRVSNPQGHVDSATTTITVQVTLVYFVHMPIITKQP